MSRVIVYVTGGNVQDVIADAPGAEVMVVDYDNEEGDPAPDRRFFAARTDPTLFSQTLERAEVRGKA